MMHYKKGKNVEEELTREQIQLDNLPQSFLWMHVKGGSRIFGLIDYAKKELESGQYRSMVWSGTGGGVGKTISCAEIMKKDYELHQVTRICYRKVEEFWDPQQEGLEPIVATRNIPSIHILLSLDEIDPKTAGYQHSRTRTTFWCDGDPDGKPGSGGTRKNYFSGPQLKKKPNRHYENEGTGGGMSGANGSGSGTAGNGGSKNKNKSKNKGGKPGAGEGGPSEAKEKKDPGGKAENKAKKAKNNENKQKAQSAAGGTEPVGKEPSSAKTASET